MNEIIGIDFAGTLVRSSAIEKAANKRFEILGIEKPSPEKQKRQHATKEHYDVVRKKIEEKYNLDDNAEISYVNNLGDEIQLSGVEIKTMMMTDLFRDAMYEVANEMGQDIFHDGMIELLRYLREKGYQLAIVSGIRSDIISGILHINNFPVEIDFIKGQDPVLSKDDDVLYKELMKKGDIAYIIGDKADDMLPAKIVGAKSIFVTWGHSLGGEKDLADYTVDLAEQIKEVIK